MIHRSLIRKCKGIGSMNANLSLKPDMLTFQIENLVLRRKIYQQGHKKIFAHFQLSKNIFITIYTCKYNFEFYIYSNEEVSCLLRVSGTT